MLPPRQGHGVAKKELGFLFCYFGYIEASIPGRPAQWAISLFAILVLPIYWCWCRGRSPYPEACTMGY